MTTAMPTLESNRLIVRPFVMADLEHIHPILNAGFDSDDTLESRREWLEWLTRNYTALANLYQPPYGDRAVVLKASNTVIGSVGVAPCYGPFDTLPYFQQRSKVQPGGLSTAEIGLFWVISNAHRGKGYATESAQLIIDWMFQHFGLKRIVAQTEYENDASIAVMRRLGMLVERNPHPEPVFFQITGILENTI